MNPRPACRRRVIEVWGPSTGEPPRARASSALSPLSRSLPQPARSLDGWLLAAKPTWGHHPSSFSSMGEILLACPPLHSPPDRGRARAVPLFSDCQTVSPDGLKTDGLTDWLTDRNAEWMIVRAAAAARETRTAAAKPGPRKHRRH